MNTPIINPMWIYLSNLCNNIGLVTFIIAVFLSVALVFCIGLYIVWLNEEYMSDDEEDIARNKKFVKWLRIGISTVIVSVIATCAIPDKQTCYTMLVGSYITPENIESTGENIKSTIDYIFEKIDELEE